MGKIGDYITENICTIRKHVKLGIVPLSLMQNYDMYLMVKSFEYEPKIMERYKKVAKISRCSVDTVRKAVREMEKACN